MAQVTLVVKVVAKKDSVEELKRELLKMVEPTRREEGCMEYNLHQDNENPAVFFFYENWKSEEALEQHIAMPHFQGFVAATGSLTEEMVINKLTLLK